MLGSVKALSSLPVHPLSHSPPHLELHPSLRRDLNRFQSLGILSRSCGLFFYFKYSEVAEFQAVALGELRDYFIEELVHDCLDGNVLTLCLLRDLLDKILFCYCWHHIALQSDCVGCNSIDGGLG